MNILASLRDINNSFITGNIAQEFPATCVISGVKKQQK